MRFDDRLCTVLRQPATGQTIARIQYRQLLDLLGTSPGETDGPQIDAAYMRLAELSARISAAERAAMLGETSLRLRNSRLVAQLAASEPAVASAAMAAAQLSDEQWLDLIPALPIQARGIVRHRRGLSASVDALLDRLGIADRGLPPTATPSLKPETTPDDLPGDRRDAIEGIGAIVRRIEQFRRTRERESETAPGEAPRLPLGDGEQPQTRRLESFDFATDAEGRIVWSDPAAAPMASGLRFAASDAESPARASGDLIAAYRRRQPIRAEPLRITGAAAIAGDWQVDAAPRFDRPGGRFVGYCGRMRRPSAEAGADQVAASSVPESEADRMRQLLHELRTPVNAIQGFAEVIQQQLFGPTPHEYRALAANIASDGARMLAGFEELDRLVRLDAGALDLEAGECDIAAVLGATVAQLESYTARRGSGFALEQPQPSPGGYRVAMAKPEAERLVWRLLATLAGAAGPGEMLRLKLRPQRGGYLRVSAQLPAGFPDAGDGGTPGVVIPIQPQALSAGMFGAGFALRLAAAEAAAAGGSLERREGKLRLSLPSPGLAESRGTEPQGRMKTL